MRFYTTLFFLTLAAVSVAQQEISWPKGDSLQITFLKQDITWDWRGYVLYSIEPAAGTGYYLRDRFNSNLLLPTRETRKWRDENFFDGFFFYKSIRAYHGLYARSWHLSDWQPQNYSQYGNHAAGLKAVYNLPYELSVVPYLGYQRAQNKDLIEWGWDLGINAQAKTIPLGSYQGNVQLNTDYDYYDRRSNSNTGISIGIKANFSPEAKDSIALNYLNDRQQYFAINAADPVNVHIENKSVFNQLHYLFSKGSVLELTTILWSRNILDELPGDINKRQVFRFENRLIWRRFYRQIILALGMNTFQETQDNLGIRTDSKSLQSGLSGDLVYLLNENNSFNLQLNLVKFQYDTPDSISNNEDRDELRFIGLLRYTRRLSPLLQFDLEAYANLFHKIYIFEELSANNNWNRIYRLSARVQYRHRDWHNVLQTAVLANYTVYDFEKLFTIPRSFIFRKYSVADSLLVPLLARLDLGSYTQIELEDRGTFFEQEFSQQLVESSRSQYYDIFLRFKNIISLQVETGINLFHWDGWRHIPVRKKEREIRRSSPYLRCAYLLGQRIRLLGSVSVNYLNDTGRERRNYTTGNLNMIYSF
jgi:hypothetical protein